MTRETALITGASSGLGLELARLFAADGSDLVLVARNREKLEGLAAELRDAHGIDARVLPKDLAVPGAAQEIFDELAAEGVTVDVLVNNAGFGLVGRVARLPVDRQVDMVQVNVTALVHLTRLFLPGMIERGRGGILNLASTAAFQPGPKLAVYYASKAFDLSFTEALAEELRGSGVRVTCLAPGPTATGFGELSGLDRTLLFRLGPMDAARVARKGYRAFRRGRVLVIPGLLNKLGACSVRFSPRWIVRRVVKGLNS